MEIEDLQIQCENCFGLCCRAFYFSKIDGFPENSSAGKACSYLCADSRCSIHSKLREKRLKGCMSYDCCGAGQHMSAWLKKENMNAIGKQMDSAIMESFYKLIKLHQQLWYLKQAVALMEEHQIRIDAATELAMMENLLGREPQKITVQDMETAHDKTNDVLKKVSLYIQRKYPNKISLTASSYLGKSFKNRSLIGCDFSMKLLIGCNFDGADVTDTNFLGSDVRDADFSNVDLRHALFLSQFQVNSVMGNTNTILPEYLKRPCTWKE